MIAAYRPGRPRISPVHPEQPWIFAAAPRPALPVAQLVAQLVALLLAAVLLALAAGCASTPKSVTDRSDSSSSQSAEANDDRTASPERSSDLADLAQRDVEAFLNRRKARSSETSSSEADDDRHASSSPAETMARASGPEIHWSDPNVEPRHRPSERPGQADRDSLEAAPTLIAREKDKPEREGADPPIEEDEDVEASAGSALDQHRVRELVVDLSKELYRDAAYADMPLRELMLIAATSLVSPDRALQPDAIPGLTPRERELLAAFQAFFVGLGHQLDGSRPADEVLDESLDNLRRMLRTEPDLTIENIALCTRVGGFGDYDPFNRYAFLAHTEQQVVLYLELKNFKSEMNQQGQWVTEISQQIVIYSDRDGIPVWREDWQTAVDVARNRRHDFFMVQLITLPRALSVGKYHLKVRARDEKSRAEAEATVTFEMVADPKMAASIP